MTSPTSQTRAGLNGLAVVAMAGGAVMLYSAIKGATVADTLRSLLKGQATTGQGSPFLAPTQQIGSTLAPVQPKLVGPGQPGGNAAIAEDAKKYIGVPYKFGQSSPSGMDCSGLVNLVCGKDLGLPIPGSPSGKYSGHGPTAAQWYVWGGLQTVPRASCRAGDLVCWTGHIGIATDSQYFIAAPTAGRNVLREKIWNTPMPLIRRYK